MAERKPAKSPRRQHPLGRALTPPEVHAMGVTSSRQFNPDQMELPGMTGEGVERPEHRPLRRWEDMAPEERSGVEQHLKSTYGVTMRNAVHNHGVLIDRSVMERGAEGQHFYSGGGGDDHSYVGAGATAEAARVHRMPLHVAAAMRAALSPRSNVHDEITNLHHVVNFARANPDHTGPVPGTIGLNASDNSRNALAVYRGHQQGLHPYDVPHPSGSKRNLFDEKLSAKTMSYMQSYTHPDDPRTRTAVDTHAVGGMAPHLPKSAPRRGTGRFDKKGQEFTQPVAMSHPDWVPNQEDALNRRGAYEFFDYAQRMAAQKRGLTPTEGQSMAWHVERGSTNIQPGSGNAASRRRGPRQPTLGV